jgi:hypothetical protein
MGSSSVLIDCCLRLSLFCAGYSIPQSYLKQTGPHRDTGTRGHYLSVDALMRIRRVPALNFSLVSMLLLDIYLLHGGKWG